MLGLAYCGAWQTPPATTNGSLHLRRCPANSLSLSGRPGRPARPCASSSSSQTPPNSNESQEPQQEQKGMPQRIAVQLRKPLGLTLEETKNGQIVVAAIIAGGNAARNGRIREGMRLIATSAVIYNTEKDYGGVAVKGEQEVVRLAVAGERFETVVAAIGAHPGFMPVTLELEQPDAQ